MCACQGGPMASTDLGDGIASLEAKAEAVLAEARARAADIIREANDQASRILADQLSIDAVKAECAALVEQAAGRARRADEESAREGERIRARARRDGGRALEAIVDRIEGMVRGSR